MSTKVVGLAVLFAFVFNQILVEAHFTVKKAAAKKWNKSKSENIVKGLNSFAFALHRTLPSDGDLFYSPYGIANALAMAFAGSGGKTRDEIANALGWNNSLPKEIHTMFGHLLVELAENRDGRKSSLLLANSVWVEKQERVQNRFRRLIERHYGGKFGKSNFYGDPEGSRKKINNWASIKTKGTIKELLPKGAINRETRVILTNAVYFKESWKNPFDVRQTKMRKFHMSSNKVKKIPMMEGYFKVSMLRNNYFTGIDLPYRGGRFSMVVLLPNSRNGLTDAEKSLNWSSLQKSSRRKRKVRIVLPKIKITSRYELTNRLRSLGVKSLFNDHCDLSRMFKAGGHVFVTNAVHQASVVVDEKGSEASAATALFLGRSLIQDFVANRPFLFFIKDNAEKLILFAGRFSPS